MMVASAEGVDLDKPMESIEAAFFDDFWRVRKLSVRRSGFYEPYR